MRTRITKRDGVRVRIRAAHPQLLKERSRIRNKAGDNGESGNKSRTTVRGPKLLLRTGRRFLWVGVDLTALESGITASVVLLFSNVG